MEVDERARPFLAMQYPSEIVGVTNAEFMRLAINARREEGDKWSSWVHQEVRWKMALLYAVKKWQSVT